MVITLHFKLIILLSQNANRNMNGRQMYFPAYLASTQKRKENEYRLSQVWIYICVYIVYYNLYLICWLSLSFMTMKKTTLLFSSRGNVNSSQLFLLLKSSTAKSSHNMLSPPELSQLPFPLILKVCLCSLTTTLAVKKKQRGKAWHVRV